MGFDRVVLETDSSVLYRSLVDGDPACSWKVGSTLSDTRYLRSCFSLCEFNLLPRAANAAADWLAKRALHKRLIMLDNSIL